MSYSTAFMTCGVARVVVNKLLRGSKASEIPIELPTKFELVINLKPPECSALTVPPRLIAVADEVMMRRRVPIVAWVKNGCYRTAILMAGSPQSTDIQSRSKRAVERLIVGAML